MGRRAAAFLTAGMARVPFWKFVVADAGTATLGVPFLLGLAYFFTDEITAIVADVHRVKRWLALAVVLVISARRWHRRIERERLDAEQTAEKDSASSR
jgi:membrane protein DedA with SNARE-associated domain